MPTLKRRWVIAALALGLCALAAVAVTLTLSNRHHDSAGDDHAMTGRAQSVMPFDLSKTTHTFAKTAGGGTEEVTANDPRDSHDIGLIRSHLQQEAARFREGDYDDPAKIHGADMPGVKYLSANATRVSISYQQLPAGARLTYSSQDPALITALHQWLDRQNTDHAMPGMGG